MFDGMMIPSGLVVQLSRHRVLDGMSAEADRCMAMLNTRRDECITTRGRDGLVVEVIFRRQEDRKNFLYWFELRSSDSTGDISSVPEEARTPIDIDHIAFTHRAKDREYIDVPPQLVLIATEVEAAVQAWICNPKPG